MAAHTLNILTPSVNNLAARIFVRAAGLDFEEVDVWGKTTTPEYLEKYPAHLTPMLEADGLPRGTLGESCAIMAFLCDKHGLDRFYPADPGERAMVEHRVVHHGPLARVGRIEPVEAVLVAQVGHDRAALPERLARQVGVLERRRQVRRVL